MADEYFIIPFTGQRVYDGTVVIISRLPSLKFVAHNGYFDYDGGTQQGWYLVDVADSSIMPLFKGDLQGMRIDGEVYPPGPPGPYPPKPGPYPPGPGPYPPGPYPPGPGPLTPTDRAVLNSAMITVPTLFDRDRLDSQWLVDGRVVRVNNASGKLAYFQWNAQTLSWEDFDLGDKFMNRAQIEEALQPLVKKVSYVDDAGKFVITMQNESVDEFNLVGVPLNPNYDEETRTLTVPVIDGEEVVVTEETLETAEFQREAEFPDGRIGEALVIDLQRGEGARKIIADMSDVVPAWEPFKPTN